MQQTDHASTATIAPNGITSRTRRLALQAAACHYTVFSEVHQLEDACQPPEDWSPHRKAALRFTEVYTKATPLIHDDELIVGAWQRDPREEGWGWLPEGDEPYVEILTDRAPAHQPEILDMARRGLLSPASSTNHKVADYGTFMGTGARELARRARALAEMHDGEEREFALAFAEGQDALVAMAQRYAEACDALATTAAPERAAELREIARICRKVPAEPATTFHEALQSYWFGYLVFTDGNGRIDLLLHEYYQADLAAGRITPERAQELIECLLIKIHTDVREGLINVSSVQTMTLGGILPDGTEGSNALTRLFLAAARNVRLLRPTIYLRCNAQTPDDVLGLALEMLGEGLSEPNFFGEAPIIEGLQRIGIPLETARDFAISGCAEVVSPGLGNWGAITGWVNVALLAEEAIRECAALEVSDAAACWGVIERHVEQLADACCACTDWLDVRPENADVRYLVSLMMPVCLDRCRDFVHGGADTYLAQWVGVGLPNAVDMLYAVEQMAFREGAPLASLLAQLDAGDPALMARLNALPKFGNDRAEVDEIAQRFLALIAGAMEGRRTALRRLTFGHLSGGENMHLAYGRQMGATLDGRKAGQPLSDSMAGAQGRTVSGPTATIQSLCRLDHSQLSAGSVSTLRLSRQDLATAGNRQQVKALIRAYIALGGSQLQLNVVDAATLHAAQDHPADYRNLLVRVAGYSADFTAIGRPLQNEIIARTEGFQQE